MAPSDDPPPTPSPTSASSSRATRPAGDPGRVSGLVSGLQTAIWTWVKRLVIAGVIVLAAATVSMWMVLKSYEDGLPSTAELKHYQPPQVTRVLARDGTLLAEVFVQRRTVVSIQQISKEMKIAVLAAEDADFYQHEGLDYLGMVRALIVNVRSREARQGGSTITQQVVKNVLLSPERTFERKARELLLARRIEQELSKDEILELYLNHIYFGHGRYGVEEACRYYFGKGVHEVSLAEAAMIAGLAKGPSLYSPRVSYERALGRRDQVLRQIAAKSFATREAVELALAEPIALAPATETMAELAPEVVTEVRRRLIELVGESAPRGGYTITTTIDPDLQAAARKAVRDNLDGYAERHGLLAPWGAPVKAAKGKRAPQQTQEVPFQGTPSTKGHAVYRAVITGADDAAGLLLVRVGTVDGLVRLNGGKRYNPKGLPPSRVAAPGALIRVSADTTRGVRGDGVPTEFHLELGPQSALVAIDVASREVRALVGSYEAVRGGLDRATRAHRQPGSTFKPFVFGYAIQSRQLTAASPVGRPPPADSDEAPLLLRDALARSVNEAAVWTLREVGPKNVMEWAKTVGIRSPMEPTESLALGAYEVTPLELATAYTTFAAGGLHEEPTLILRIVGSDGAEVTVPSATQRRRVMEEADAFLMTDLMTSVVDYGTGRKAREIGFEVAGKTGTSNDAKDAWFAGYSRDVACVVWTGFDDAVPLGPKESGATAALPAWIEFMKAAHARRKPAPFERPEGVIAVEIDPKTGLLPYEGQEKTRPELFLVGTEPQQVAEGPVAEDPYAELDDELAAEEQAERDAQGGTPAPAPLSQTATPVPARNDEPPPF